MAIVGMVGAVYASTLDEPTAFADKPTTKDAERKRYQVTDATLRYWPLDQAITVKKNGTVITTGFSLERVGGVVVFATALTVEDVVLVSGKALTLKQCGGFFNWSIDTESDTEEVSTFGSNGWKEFEQTLNNWSGSAEAYWGDDNFIESVGELLVVKLFVDAGAAKQCLEGFAIISGDSIEAPVDGIVNESIDFQGTGPLYLRL